MNAVPDVGGRLSLLALGNATCGRFVAGRCSSQRWCAVQTLKVAESFAENGRQFARGGIGTEKSMLTFGTWWFFQEGIMKETKVLQFEPHTEQVNEDARNAGQRGVPVFRCCGVERQY